MPSSRKGGTPSKQDWWDTPSDKDDKQKHREALEDYLKDEELEAADVEFSMDLVKQVIDEVGYKDPKWKKFPKDSFDITKHKAHRSFYDTILRHLEELKKAAQVEEEDAEEAAIVEKLKEKTREELKKEHDDGFKPKKKLVTQHRSSVVS